MHRLPRPNPVDGARVKARIDCIPYAAVTATEVADHFDHVARAAGHDHAGIGADLDGIRYTPNGLERVET